MSKSGTDKQPASSGEVYAHPAGPGRSMTQAHISP
jgi:hypothetical protein